MKTAEVRQAFPVSRSSDIDIDRDRELVCRAQNGDKSAFDDLYACYFSRLEKYCFRRLADPFEAQDIAQESFLRAWKALPQFAGDRRFYPWLSVIASNLCTDVLRRRRRFGPVPVAEPWERDVATGSTTEDSVVASVEIDMAAKAFSHLSDRHQRVLDLREASGMSYQEIADKEGIGITTVETLIWRARKAFKREYSALVDSDERLAAIIGAGSPSSRIAEACPPCRRQGSGEAHRRRTPSGGNRRRKRSCGHRARGGRYIGCSTPGAQCPTGRGHRPSGAAPCPNREDDRIEWSEKHRTQGRKLDHVTGCLHSTQHPGSAGWNRSVQSRYRACEIDRRTHQTHVSTFDQAGRKDDRWRCVRSSGDRERRGQDPGGHRFFDVGQGREQGWKHSQRRRRFRRSDSRWPVEHDREHDCDHDGPGHRIASSAPGFHEPHEDGAYASGPSPKAARLGGSWRWNAKRPEPVHIVMTISFGVTYDYRCPFARNAHEHVIEALRSGADWDVQFVPFSLSQIHVDEGGTPVWDDPTKSGDLLALEASIVVANKFPDRFFDVHEALFAVRHDEARDLRDEKVVSRGPRCGGGRCSGRNRAVARQKRARAAAQEPRGLGHRSPGLRSTDLHRRRPGCLRADHDKAAGRRRHRDGDDRTCPRPPYRSPGAERGQAHHRLELIGPSADQSRAICPSSAAVRWRCSEDPKRTAENSVAPVPSKARI